MLCLVRLYKHFLYGNTITDDTVSSTKHVVRNQQSLILYLVVSSIFAFFLIDSFSNFQFHVVGNKDKKEIWTKYVVNCTCNCINRTRKRERRCKDWSTNDLKIICEKFRSTGYIVVNNRGLPLTDNSYLSGNSIGEGVQIHKVHQSLRVPSERIRWRRNTNISRVTRNHDLPVTIIFIWKIL